jgi:hypothetical protein
MAMEDLLRIAERTEDLPDQALAQIAASGGGIESVIAASEMKARNDIRQDAQMMQQQAQPPVVDQLINMAMRQPMPPMGAAMPPQMQQPMGQPMPPQMGMQQPMPQPTPPQMAPDMAQLAQQMGVPAMNTGGLIRRFQNNQGTIGGGNFFDFYQQQLGYDPRSILAGNVQAPANFSLTPEQIEQLQEQYESAMSGTDIYSDQVEAAAQDYRSILPNPPSMGSLSGVQFVAPLKNPVTKQQSMDRALEEARLDAARNLLTSSGLPKGNIQSLMPVGSQTPVQAFVPGGQQRTVLPSGYSLFSPTAASGPPAGTAPPPASSTGGSAGGSAAVNQQPGGQKADSSAPFGSTTIPFTGTQQTQMLFTGPTSVLGGGSATTLDPSLAAIFNPSGTRSTATSKTTRTLSDEMLADLIKREGEYNQTINDATEKMKTLEGDLPTRENIKDRIKEQTRLGMAKAFFDAAGSGSPDFLSALAQGMGGAAGVMNKMTGEEQKELHQHALQMFQLEREKANTAFARQEKTLSQIQAARQYEDARRVQDRQAQIDLLEFQRNYNDDVYQRNKDNADYQESYRAILADRTDKFDAAIKPFRDSKFRFDGDVRELDMEIAINSGYGVQKVPAAERLENEGVRKLIGDMSAEAQKLTDAEKQLPLSQQEVLIRERLGKRYDEDSLLGRRAALDVHGPLLKDIFGSIDTDRYDSEVAKYLKTYPHIDPSLLTENASPIF